MSLTLELSRETQNWLQTEAAKQGVDPGEYALQLIENNRPQAPATLSTDDSERLAAIDAAMGAFTHVPVSSKDFACRKQEEIDLEEAKFMRH